MTTASAPTTASAERATDTDALRGLPRALDRARAEGRTLVLHLPAPMGDPLALLDVDRAEPALAWCPAEGAAVAAIGIAARIDAEGDDRFVRVRDRADALLRSVDVVGDGPAPRLFGGFAFAVGQAAEPEWAPFGDASFVLPRWTYTRTDGSATLTLALDPRRASPISSLRDELHAIVDALVRPRTLPSALPPVRSVEHLPRDAYRRQIDEIERAIEDGAVSKIVLARRSVVVLDGDVDARLVLTRLVSRFVGCTAFAFRRGGATFVGATPERLLALEGRSVRTLALAGSIGAGEADGETRLVASDKDRAEHRFVVAEIERRLAPFCAEIRRPDAPEVRRLPNVFHLATPIVGQLAAPRHVLDLVASLHPTPAVGGVPTEDAVAWITRTEPAPRGWYAGPVGWLDVTGAGDFAVALRSGLLFGERAWLYAGGGIVRGSTADAEYEEGAMKLDALLSALVSPDRSEA